MGVLLFMNLNVNSGNWAFKKKLFYLHIINDNRFNSLLIFTSNLLPFL